MLARRRFVFSGLAMTGLASVGARLSQGQGFSRYTSPPANASVTIAGKKIDIAYYAPSMRGRKVMGGLVPYGEVWCTGANWATTITSEAPLEMGTLKLAKGSFTIWTLPNEKEWLLIINKQTGQFHRLRRPRDPGRTKMNLWRRRRRRWKCSRSSARRRRNKGRWRCCGEDRASAGSRSPW